MSLLPLDLKGCYKVTNSGPLRDSGIPLAQLLEASPMSLETQGSFYPTLMDMVAVFLFASSTNSKSEHVSQRYTHRDREGTNAAPLQYKKSPSSSGFPLLTSYKVRVVS